MYEVDGQCQCGLESDEDGRGGEEKERKTEVEVDGQCECLLEGEGTKPGCVEATFPKHRPHIEVGKDAVAEEEDQNYSGHGWRPLTKLLRPWLAAPHKTTPAMADGP